MNRLKLEIMDNNDDGMYGRSFNSGSTGGFFSETRRKTPSPDSYGNGRNNSSNDIASPRAPTSRSHEPSLQQSSSSNTSVKLEPGFYGDDSLSMLSSNSLLENRFQSQTSTPKFQINRDYIKSDQNKRSYDSLSPPNSKINNTRRSKNFSHEEIVTLLGVWGDNSIQDKFKTLYRHSALWTTIAQRMQDKGFDRDENECKVKISNLKAEYLRLKRSWKPDCEPPLWPFWDRMQAVIDCKSGNSSDHHQHVTDSMDSVDGDQHHSSMSPATRLALDSHHPDTPTSQNERCTTDGDSDDSHSLIIDESVQEINEPLPPAPTTYRQDSTQKRTGVKRAKRRKKSEESSRSEQILLQILDIERETLRLHEQRLENEATVMTAMTTFFNTMSQLFTSATNEHRSQPSTNYNDNANPCSNGGGNYSSFNNGTQATSSYNQNFPNMSAVSPPSSTSTSMLNAIEAFANAMQFPFQNPANTNLSSH